MIYVELYLVRRSEHCHDRKVVFRTASVDEELVVEMRGLVALRLVLDVDGEVLPVRLDKVVTKGIDVGIFRAFALSFVPTSLVGDPVVGDKTLGLIIVLSVVGRLCGIVDRGIGWLVQVGLVMGDEHLHAEIDVGVFQINGFVSLRDLVLQVLDPLLGKVVLQLLQIFLDPVQL